MRSGGDNLSVWEFYKVRSFISFELAHKNFLQATVVVYVSVIYCLLFYSSIVTRVVGILLVLLYICNFFAITLSFNPTKN